MASSFTKNPKSIIRLLLWLILLGLALAWRAQNLDAFGLSNDEGAHLMWARLAVDGYPLYGQTYAVQSPLFLESVGLAFRLAGQTIQAGRWAMLTGFVLLAVVLSWLAYRAGGWLAALATMFLLGISSLIFTFSRLVMAEVPATGLAVAALALGFVYVDREHKGWLFASGLLLGLSFITKALHPFVVAPVGFLLLVRHFGNDRKRQNGQTLRVFKTLRVCTLSRSKGLILDGLLWGLGVIAPLAVLPLIYQPAAIYDQLLVFRRDLHAAIPGSWAETGEQFVIFINSHWGFWWLAGGGIVTALVRICVGKKPNPTLAVANLLPSLTPPPGRGEDKVLPPVGGVGGGQILYPLTWSVWLVSGVGMLLWHTPLFPHHFIVLLPPLMLLAASFITDIVTLARRWRAAVILWLVVVPAAFNFPAMIEANQQTVAIVTGGRETEALALLEAVSRPDDFLMGDSQLLIFMAHRRTPPPLGDVALVAIKAGRQTSARMIALTEEFQAPAVVQWSLRLPWLPEYLAWVEAHYLARRVWDNDHLIYYAPGWPVNRPVPHEQTIRLGDRLVLRGYELDESVVTAGQALSLKIYWQTNAPLTQDYTVFTQLLDRNGALVAGRDSQPLGGYFPTSQWPAHEIITDVTSLALPANLPPGDYALITGMYLLETLERLPQPNGADHIVLTTIHVE
ncbi:MAG: phospholipid carrier-dependent glycosyltransferase [Anaerolineae bacterium]|nr:phospholipid carrier-dependent glycosyltransferase [Anaerolineae bacterium]